MYCLLLSVSLNFNIQGIIFDKNIKHNFVTKKELYAIKINIIIKFVIVYHDNTMW